MTFDFMFENDYFNSLKADLGISKDNAHRLELSLWQYSQSRKPTIECKVSVFTNEGRCVQGHGVNFYDAFTALCVALKPKSQILEPGDEVKVLTEG